MGAGEVCLQPVTRLAERRLSDRILRGLASEDTIPAESLVDGEECWLSNGVRGFFFGRIKLT